MPHDKWPVTFRGVQTHVVFADIPHRIRIRIGEENADLAALLKDKSVRSWAYLTAFNPGSNRLPAEENKRRQRQLGEIVGKTYRQLYRGEGISDGGDRPAEASVRSSGSAERKRSDWGRDLDSGPSCLGTSGKSTSALTVQDFHWGSGESRHFTG